MSSLEEIVYEAYELGLRDELFDKISKYRAKHPRRDLVSIYDKALSKVKKQNGYGREERGD